MDPGWIGLQESKLVRGVRVRDRKESRMDLCDFPGLAGIAAARAMWEAGAKPAAVPERCHFRRRLQYAFLPESPTVFECGYPTKEMLVEIGVRLGICI